MSTPGAEPGEGPTTEGSRVRGAPRRTSWFAAGAFSALAGVAAVGAMAIGLSDRTSDDEVGESAATSPPSTTAATTTTSTSPPTTAPAVAADSPAPTPEGIAFLETFDDNLGLDRFDTFVFHRNIDIHDYDGLSGGSWSADHDLACGSPDTQRPMRFEADDAQETRQANSFYMCRDHLMTTMGDVENYSIAAFSPAVVFDDVSEVRFDVNLTDLGNRQWWKVGVLSVTDCPRLDTECIYSDVVASDRPSDLATSGRLIASWSGGLSAGYPGGLKIGNTQTDQFFDAGDDKATRHPVSLTDNGDGTVTFNVADRSATVEASFPACPCRVVLYDHNYTPDKSEAGPGTQHGYTWHWDNVQVNS